MDKRLGFIGIIVYQRDKNAPKVNKLISEYASLVKARMGLPYEKKNCSVIVLIIEATVEELGSFTGKLGALPGVRVKSALTKQ